MRELPKVIVLKNLIRHLMVLMTIVFGLMLTSCLVIPQENYQVEAEGGGEPRPRLTGTFELPPVPTATVAWNSNHDNNTLINVVATSIKATVAYSQGYFGQSVTIAFIDEGLQISGTEGNYTHHRTFGAPSSTRIVKPVRISGTSTSTLASDLDVFNFNGYAFNLGKHAMAFAAGQLADGRNPNVQYGVAISSSLMPIDIVDGGYSTDGDFESGLNYAIDNGANVIFYGLSEVVNVHTTISHDDKSYTTRLDYYYPFISTLNGLGFEVGTGVANMASRIGARVENEDVVILVGTGRNDGNTYLNAWNSVQGTVNLSGISVANIIMSVTTFVNEVTINSFGIGTSTIKVTINKKASEFFGEDGSNMPFGLVVNTPLFDARLQSKFLVVVGTYPNGTIHLANGCGAHKHWCVSAPNSFNTTAPGAGDTSHGSFQIADYLHDYSAAVAAGALAVVKSRMPDLPLAAARAVLLTTASKLGGFTGVSPVYGHGNIDLEAAMSLVGSISVAAPISTTTTSSQLLVNSSIVLSPAFRNLQQQVSNISMAVDVLGNGFYFDSPFSSVMNDDAIQNQVMTLGFAAGDMDTSA